MNFGCNAAKATFEPRYGWPVHIFSTIYCAITLASFLVLWLPPSLILQIPLQWVFKETLWPPPESFQKFHPESHVAKLGRRIFRDERDWFKIYYTFYVSFLLWPAAVYTALCCSPTHYLLQGSLYLTFLFGPEFKIFINMFGCLHMEGHMAWRKGVCNPGFSFLNRHLEYALGTLAGHIPELTATCHVKIHHTHTNREGDTESLLAYDKLSAMDFFFKFLPDQFTRHALNIEGLVIFYKQQNWTMFRRLLFGTAFYALLAMTVLWLNPLAFCVLVAIPLSVFNFIVCLVTWTQHTFLYKQEFENSITILIDTDVYAEAIHISHHTNLHRHPFDHRDWFDNWKENIYPYMNDAEFRPFIFRDLDALQFFFLLVSGNKSALARKFVDIGSPKLSEEDTIAYLENCSKPQFSKALLNK